MSQAEPAPRQLALWGPSSAGKTALLAQLFHAVPPDSDWEVLPAAEAQIFVERTRNSLRRENRFPGATAPGGFEPLRLHFRHRRSGLTATVSVEDRAGVDFEDFAPIGPALAQAEGLVMLLDPQNEAALLESFLRRTLERLSHVRSVTADRDPRPIAVCLTKADLRIRTPEDLALAVLEPETFVRRWLDPRCLAPLGTYCERFRLFPISAIGVRLRWGAVEPVVFVDEQGRERLCLHASPVNLLAPFAWVLEQLSGG